MKKKLQILGIALIAVLAFGAMTVATASGAISTLLAEWLVDNVGVAAGTELLIEAHGELLLEDTKAPIVGKAAVLCSGILDGWIGANGSDLITELLDLESLSISQLALTEPGLTCTNETNCEEPLVWAVHLPWRTLLELVVDGAEEFFAVLISNSGNGNPGWYVSCMKGPLGETTDECTAATGTFKATNEGNNVDALFEDPFTELVELVLASCSLGGAASGIVEGLGTILPPAGSTTLAVSST